MQKFHAVFYSDHADAKNDSSDLRIFLKMSSVVRQYIKRVLRTVISYSPPHRASAASRLASASLRPPLRWPTQPKRIGPRGHNMNFNGSLCSGFMLRPLGPILLGCGGQRSGGRSEAEASRDAAEAQWGGCRGHFPSEFLGQSGVCVKKILVTLEFFSSDTRIFF